MVEGTYFANDIKISIGSKKEKKRGSQIMGDVKRDLTRVGGNGISYSLLSSMLDTSGTGKSPFPRVDSFEEDLELLDST